MWRELYLNQLTRAIYKYNIDTHVNSTWSPSQAIRPTGRRWSLFRYPSERHQFTVQDHGYAVWLFMSQLSLLLIAPTHGGMARLSWRGRLLTYRDGLPACQRSPIQVLTGPGVDWFSWCNHRRYHLSQTATTSPCQQTGIFHRHSSSVNRQTDRMSQPCTKF